MVEEAARASHKTHDGAVEESNKKVILTLNIGDGKRISYNSEGENISNCIGVIPHSSKSREVPLLIRLLRPASTITSETSAIIHSVGVTEKIG